LGVNKKNVNKNRIFFRVRVIESSEPKGVKPKMRARKLLSGVNWQGTLNQKGVKQGLGVQ
jgi:hypothetical protein